MATRSTISLVHEDNTTQTIYCHWDGYLDGLGTYLLKHYTDPKKVGALIALGDRSSIKDENAYGTGPARMYYRGPTEVLERESQEYNYFFNTRNNKWYVQCEYIANGVIFQLTPEAIEAAEEDIDNVSKCTLTYF